MKIDTTKEIISSQLLEKTNERNPLKIAYKNNSQYFSDFLEFMTQLHNEISVKDCNSILIDKLQLAKDTFDENQYYEAATELSVIFLFSSLKHNEFKYEFPVNKGTKKQPECFVKTLLGSTYCAEAKCPCQNKQMPDGNCIKYHSIGRANSIDMQNLFLKNFSSNFAKKIVLSKSEDNKMLDYLQSASLKFSEAKRNDELNVLFVALDSVEQIRNWVNYFYYNKGFFTSNSFAADIPYCYTDRHSNSTYIDPNFPNVHFIVFTNSFFRHKNNTKINGSAWKLNDGFNFAIQNRFASLQHKKETITEFFTKYLYHNYTKDIENYKMQGDYGELQDIINVIKLDSFIKDELEGTQGIFLWEKK